MEVLSEYIVVLILALCLGIGYIIKHSLDFIPNKYIPLILAIVGVVVNMWANQWMFTPETLTQGIASGLGATGAFEAGRHLLNKEV